MQQGAKIKNKEIKNWLFGKLMKPFNLNRHKHKIWKWVSLQDNNMAKKQKKNQVKSVIKMNKSVTKMEKSVHFQILKSKKVTKMAPPNKTPRENKDTMVDLAGMTIQISKNTKVKMNRKKMVMKKKNQDSIRSQQVIWV